MDELAREIIVYVVRGLVKDGMTREQIGNYIDRNVVDDVFRSLDEEKKFPEQISDLTFDLYEKLFVMASASKAIREVGSDLKDIEFKRDLVGLLIQLEYPLKRIKNMLKLVRTTRHRGQYRE